jgi:hypothetical protein
VKRPSQDVAGGPKVRDRSVDVAGRSISSGAIDVARTRHGLYNTSWAAADRAALIADFMDFLSATEGLEGGARFLPDSAFKERLRRRLWRNHFRARQHNHEVRH